MPVSQEYHVNTQTFEQHVRMTLAMGLLPVILSVVYLATLPAEKPFLAYWTLGASLSVCLLLAGGHQLCFEENTGTQWGSRFYEAAPQIFPGIFLLLRYLLFAFSLLLIWQAAKALGLEINLWMDISFYTMLVLHPLHTFFVVLFDPGRRKSLVLLVAFVRLLKVNANMSLGLSLLSTTPAAESVRKGQGMEIAIAVFLPCVLFSIVSLITFIDRVARYEHHKKTSF